jgi:hypothetical protein
MTIVARISSHLPRSLKDRIPNSMKSKYYERKAAHERRTKSEIDGPIEILKDLENVPLEKHLQIQTEGLSEEADVEHHVGAIEINDSCNLNCVMCRSNEATRSKGLMDLGLFEEIVIQLVSKGIRTTNFHTIGDPTVNKNLSKYLEILKRHGVTLHHLSSNCQMLERQIDTIMEYRNIIGHFRPSIDAASKDVYEFIRVNGTWDILQKNLAMFADRNASVSNPIPVYVKNVIMKQNYHELAFMPDVFSFLTPETFHSFDFAMWLGPALRDMEGSNYFDGEYTLNRPCGYYWENIIILKDGALSTCCVDFTGDPVFGHFNDGELKDTYNNDTIKSWRRAHITGEVSAIPEMCKSCYIVDPRYSKVVNGLILHFYHHIKKHPVYLQNKLNEIGPMLREHRFADARTAIETF